MDLLQHDISKALAAGFTKIILDGFPRNVDQAVLFDERIGPCKAAISLQCPKKILLERLTKRSETSGRIDDNIVTFEKRYEGFLQESMPVVEHLKATKAMLIEVSSNEKSTSTKLTD
ncbi:MAG: hypothetical protein M1837_004343 [Sclerophora amabilis]|nr:MAG: hypothetical protein M1837_004343 [Sclerophora amabilis]